MWNSGSIPFLLFTVSPLLIYCEVAALIFTPLCLSIGQIHFVGDSFTVGTLGEKIIQPFSCNSLSSFLTPTTFMFSPTSSICSSLGLRPGSSNLSIILLTVALPNISV